MYILVLWIYNHYTSELTHCHWVLRMSFAITCNMPHSTACNQQSTLHPCMRDMNSSPECSVHCKASQYLSDWSVRSDRLLWVIFHRLTIHLFRQLKYMGTVFWQTELACQVSTLHTVYFLSNCIQKNSVIIATHPISSVDTMRCSDYSYADCVISSIKYRVPTVLPCPK